MVSLFGRGFDSRQLHLEDMFQKKQRTPKVGPYFWGSLLHRGNAPPDHPSLQGKGTVCRNDIRCPKQNYLKTNLPKQIKKPDQAGVFSVFARQR